VTVVEPETGHLASGHVGTGGLAVGEASGNNPGAVVLANLVCRPSWALFDNYGLDLGRGDAGDRPGRLRPPWIRAVKKLRTGPLSKFAKPMISQRKGASLRGHDRRRS